MQPQSKGAELPPPQINSLASPHRPKASDGSLEPRRRELELELIQSHMAQKPMLRGEVGARALRVRSESIYKLKELMGTYDTERSWDLF